MFSGVVRRHTAIIVRRYANEKICTHTVRCFSNKFTGINHTRYFPKQTLFYNFYNAEFQTQVSKISLSHRTEYLLIYQEVIIAYVRNLLQYCTESEITETDYKKKPVFKER